LAPYRSDPKYGTITAPGEWNRALHFNLSKGFPFSDTKFRQAVAYTVDRKDLVKRILLGQGAPGSMGDLAPSNLYAALGLPTYDRDIVKAKSLLDEIGMKDATGDGIRDLPDGSAFVAELQTSSGFSPKTAEAIKEYLRDIGLDITIKSLDATAADASSAQGNYQMALVGYGGMGGDPDSLRTRLASNVTGQFLHPDPGLQQPGIRRGGVQAAAGQVRRRAQGGGTGDATDRRRGRAAHFPVALGCPPVSPAVLGRGSSLSTPVAPATHASSVGGQLVQGRSRSGRWPWRLGGGAVSTRAVGRPALLSSHAPSRLWDRCRSSTSRAEAGHDGGAGPQSPAPR
jgi:hypothetical protein